MVDLFKLKKGDVVTFTNKTTAIVKDIVQRDDVFLVFFDREVGCDTKGIFTDTDWVYKADGTIYNGTPEDVFNNIVSVSSGKFSPKDNETYFVTMLGNVGECSNRRQEVTDRQMSVGCVFKTKEEAEKELKRQKAETELLSMCDNHLKGTVYTINYDVNKDKFAACKNDGIFESPYRFATVEQTFRAIEKVGDEGLKLIFRL